MKKIAVVLLALSLLLGVASAESLTPVVVGATTSPHAEILELVKDDMAALGYDLQIVEFTDYNLPNDALANNELDANYFQHLPFLNAYNATVSEEKDVYKRQGGGSKPGGDFHQGSRLCRTYQ